MIGYWPVLLLLTIITWATPSISIANADANANTTITTNRNTSTDNYLQLFFTTQPTTFEWIVFTCLILIALEGLCYITIHTQRWCCWIITIDSIPVRGRHLDDFNTTDWLFLSFNKLMIVPFAYLYVRFGLLQMTTNPSHINPSNTLLPIPLLFICYDFTYTIFHGILHIPAIYHYVHKHHHRQKAPSRANNDAANVHPLEFLPGEYNHLLVVYFVHTYLLHMHFCSSILFLAIGAFLAGWNHTRYDLAFMHGIYDSKAHDVHHRIPRCNYGQYIMLWDVIFGTYRKYDANDRINPMAQLDPKTGKSLNYQPEHDHELEHETGSKKEKSL